MEMISLTTINIENGNRNPKLISERSNLIMKYEPDIILIQESNLSSINLDEKYNLIKYEHKKINEKMDIFLKKDSNWILDSVNHIISELGYVKRICKIISIKHKQTNKLLNIANIHLIGGRFEENDKIGKMLIGNIKTIQELSLNKSSILEILRTWFESYKKSGKMIFFKFLDKNDSIENIENSHKRWRLLNK